MVSKGDRLSLRASGQIGMTPWGGNRMSGPGGNAGTYGWYDQASSFPTGALGGRIGSTGKFFLVGERKSMVATRSGMLYLAVAIPQSYTNNNFPGQFKVIVHVEPAEMK